MLFRKDPKVSGKEHYQHVYQHDLQDQAEWLRRGAIEKVNSIEQLLKRNHIRPKTLLELGCGTGAVIMECQRRGLAERYIAVDSSQEAIQYLSRNSAGIKAIVADITASESLLEECDVLVLTHVIEHLEEPLEFLQSLRGLQFSCLIAEVPLEDLLGGRLKALFSDRTRNAAGHVQFYTARSFEHLLSSSGFVIDDTRKYVPILDSDTIRLVCKMNGWGLLRRIRIAVTARLVLPVLSPLWSRLYYAHYAAICRKH